MNRFRQRFGKRAFLPVIHLYSTPLAIEMAKIAVESGADGVFLINHGAMNDMQIPEIAGEIRAVLPGLWIGANYLSLGILDAIAETPQEINGLWTDNSQVDERLSSTAIQDTPENFLKIRQSRSWEGIYFGGTAFKYQRPVTDFEKAAQYAARFMDVVTTSGMGTGIAADATKIRRMKTALREDGFEDFPLAVASGITPENVHAYLPFADAFLVSTGICRNLGMGDDFYYFDPIKVRQLAERIRSYAGVVE